MLWFGVIVIAITSIPYALGYLRSNDEIIFTGFFLGVEDGNSYIAKMLSGSYGSWLFRTPYSAYPQSGVIAFLPYLLLGKLAKGAAIHGQLIGLFHLFRWIGIILYVLATYDFLSHFITGEVYRKLGVMLAAFGGGLGWLFVIGLGKLWGVATEIPLEFYSPETFGFLEILSLPHLAVGRAFLLWGLLCYLQQFEMDEKKSIRTSLAGGLCLFVLGLMQPLTVVIGLFLMAIHYVIHCISTIITGDQKLSLRDMLAVFGKHLPQFICLFVFSAPLIIYTSIKFLTDPFLQIWSTQNIITSPPIHHYLFAYGLFLPFVLSGTVALIKDRKKIYRFSFILMWFALIPILAYIPVNVQRRLTEGSWVALIILFFIGSLSIGVKKRMIHIISIVSLLPSLIILFGSVNVALSGQSPAFITKQEVRIYTSLEAKSEPGQIVLCSYLTCNNLPAWAPLRTLIGHGPESAKLEEMIIVIDKYFDPNSTDNFRKKVLSELNISYLLYGPSERMMGSWDPLSANYFEIIDEIDSWVIFRVKNE